MEKMFIGFHHCYTLEMEQFFQTIEKIVFSIVSKQFCFYCFKQSQRFGFFTSPVVRLIVMAKPAAVMSNINSPKNIPISAKFFK